MKLTQLTSSTVICILILSFQFPQFAYSQSRKSPKYTNPSSCNSNDGIILIHGQHNAMPYHIAYTLNDVLIQGLTVTSEANGDIKIANLTVGNYSNIMLTDSNGTIDTVPGPITLLGSKIATQVTKFFGAAYANFTGIQDDNPTGFAQFYARLSQPLNKYKGINCDADGCERLIPLRNLYLQLSYGNTDTYKMYTYDTINDKYVNRLDLLAHSYFDATFGLNLLTYVLPKSFGCKPSGDMAHFYLDIIVGLSVTNVTDTLKSNNTATNINYNVKSNIFGLNTKASFSDAFNTKFNIELAYKLLFVFPGSSTVNPNQSPQNTNVPDLNYEQNKNKSFLTNGNHPYNQFDVWVSYNTGSGTATNQSQTTSNSNVFLKYTYVTNYAGSNSRRYANNYFQFQIGYVLDITKLFYAQSSSGK